MFAFDQISRYMHDNNVPAETMGRVKLWCQHTWKTQKSFDELEILEFLPTKMRADVAMDVHYTTIKGVKLFHGCDSGKFLLSDITISIPQKSNCNKELHDVVLFQKCFSRLTESIGNKIAADALSTR